MEIFFAIAMLCLNTQFPEQQFKCQKFYVNCMSDQIANQTPIKYEQERKLKSCISAYQG